MRYLAESLLKDVMRSMERVVDKFAHVGLGVIIDTAIRLPAAHLFGADVARWSALAGVAGAALVREWYNVRNGGEFNPMDVIATVAGWFLVELHRQP